MHGLIFIIACVVGSFGLAYRESDHYSTTPRIYRSNDEVPLRIVLFMGSVRDGRNAWRVAKYVERKLMESGHDVDLIDPEIVDLPLLRRPLHFYTTITDASSNLRRFNDQVKRADAFVIMTPEYNRQLPPALTNLLDHLPPISYAFRMSGIVAYSVGSGGLMAAGQARGLMTELGAPPIPMILHIPQVDKHLDVNGNVQWNKAVLDKQFSKFITQLDWFATAIRRHFDNVGRPSWNSTNVSS